MRKDDHLIFESFAQQRLLSDEQAAKMIADKIRGTPNLNINTIKQYVSKYLGMVGKAPTDVDYLAAQVHDILSQQGLAGENAEDEPHGYPQGMTAIQNLLLNELKKRGFTLTKISHEDKDRDKYATVFMKRTHLGLTRVAEIDGMGYINGDPYKEYLGKLDRSAGDDRRPDEDDPYYDTWQSIRQDHAGEDAEGALTYDPMHGLAKTAHEIRDILQGAANDEARTEHIIKMAQLILGDKKDYADAEYRKMLDGLIVLLNRFIVTPMN